jgi:hypothetical protein
MGKLHIHRGQDGALDFIKNVLPDGAYRRIVIKPNWVKHQEDPAFPIEALVTSAELIDLTIQACLAKYKHIDRIAVGDVPLQTCDWALLCRQSGVDKLIEKYRGHHDPAIDFKDWRKERWVTRKNFMRLVCDAPGDPRGYVEVYVDEKSMLEEVSHNAEKFRVSDYDPEETISRHKKGRHHYLICKTILEADLVINLPKMKTHQKSGITGALKNLVGINGSKAYLVHHQKGAPGSDADEFPPDGSRLVYWQVRARELLQKRSSGLFRAAKIFWDLFKRIKGIQTRGTRENLSKNFYIGSGSWYGNDSIWRMVYDLNSIILLAADAGGPLKSEPQRTVFSLMDAFIAGEGNGPLQPLPVRTNLLIASDNPFLVDVAAAGVMGFDWKKIRMLANYKKFIYQPWSEFAPEAVNITTYKSERPFIPPPGWRGHIESEESK